VTTIANLSPGEVARDLGPGEVLTVLASTKSDQRDTKVAGELVLGPWEALVASAGPLSEES
jgi:hypothetical protein